MFSSLILKPRFDADDFTRNKDLALSYLEKTLRGTDDEDLGKETLNLSLFAGHPYGTAGATVSGLKSITMDDVKAYYQRYYVADNFWIGIAGGYPKTLPERMKKDFSARGGGDSTVVKLPQPRKKFIKASLD